MQQGWTTVHSLSANRQATYSGARHNIHWETTPPYAHNNGLSSREKYTHPRMSEPEPSMLNPCPFHNIEKEGAQCSNLKSRNKTEAFADSRTGKP